MTLSLSASSIRVVVLDIEGTTTRVSFVYDVLFPFARTHASAFLGRHADSEECRRLVALLASERAADRDADAANVPTDLGGGSVVRYVHWLMDRDRKSPGLKELQGLIWQDGYRRGELRGDVYPDVVPALDRWKALGIKIYIYSSGSVLAQQLLFSTTQAGDLTNRLSGYFDTAVGPKASPESYRLIVNRIDVRAGDILFVSDVAAELDAAREAGLQTALCVRGSDQPRSSHPIVRTFDEIVD